MNPIGLYIHTPFCNGKCPYCNFYSISANDEIMDNYTNAICEEIHRWNSRINRPADTLYFGGGTPSLLGNKRIQKIVNATKDTFLLHNSEVTIEVNPTKLENLNFKELKSTGVNRLSIGLQSSNNNELQSLGRKHTANDAEKTIKLAQDAGFDNISVDLMLGISHQTPQSLIKSIEFCSSLNIQHVSAYMLKIEQGTPYYNNPSSLNLPKEDEQSDMYLLACKELELAGFKQYEISNFSKPQKESEHNLKYWNIGEYLGLGPSAHSFIGGKRFFYTQSLNDFLDKKEPIYDDVGGTEEEYIIMQLRLSSGLENNKFKKRFGHDIPKYLFKKCDLYQKSGFLLYDNNSIKFTQRGFLVSNELISQILLNNRSM